MLDHIAQEHHSGCFVAAAAMLSGRSYTETFKLLFPQKKKITNRSQAYIREYDTNLKNFVASKLEKLGLATRVAKTKQVRSILRHGKRNALIILRWGNSNEFHALAYDVERKKFLDPTYRRYKKSYIQKYLHAVIYVI